LSKIKEREEAEEKAKTKQKGYINKKENNYLF
jgi:hypothetical protein